MERDNLVNLEPNLKIDKLLVYNIVFYYHEEDIDIFDYYLENIKNLLNKINLIYDISINFYITFIVSKLDEFIKKLEKKFLLTYKSKIKQQEIYENNSNKLKTNYYELKIEKYDFIFKCS